MFIFCIFWKQNSRCLWQYFPNDLHPPRQNNSQYWKYQPSVYWINSAFETKTLYG